MKKDVVPVMTRLPVDLHAALKLRAQREERSLNGLIVVLLRAGMAPQPGANAVDAADAAAGDAGATPT